MKLKFKFLLYRYSYNEFQNGTWMMKLTQIINEYKLKKDYLHSELEPIQLAIFYHRYLETKQILEDGADIHIVGPEGRTLAHYALSFGLHGFISNNETGFQDDIIQMLELLKLKGASLNVRDEWERSPSDYCVLQQYLKVVQWLENKPITKPHP
jgi:ankyrin repeat protein